MQAKSLQRKCDILAAQVDALELRCSQSEALEKDMTEALHIKDRQVGLEGDILLKQQPARHMVQSGMSMLQHASSTFVQSVT